MTATAARADANADFRTLADQYFDQVTFAFSPSQGTSVGFHQYDAKLEDYSRRSIEAEIAALHNFEKKFEDLRPTQLDVSTRGDYEMVLNDIRSKLLTLEVI